MARPSLTELTEAAAAANDPGFTPASVPRFGGVDPLGLRQINFDLMDQVIPGLNNVARHIRPFVLVAWAWRRAFQLAKNQGSKMIAADRLQDFVDRIEVIYVWSQLLVNGDVDLPGSQVLANLVRAEKWTFGGSAWQQRRNVRRYSTALSAPVNYGPALKMLGWVQRHPHYPDIFMATPAAGPALDAFEQRIGDRLSHPAFSKFGSVTVTRDEARQWAKAWALDGVIKAEAQAMAEMLYRSKAPVCRQLAGELMFAAAKHSCSTDVERVRSLMAGPPSKFTPSSHLVNTREAWRRIQVRQLLRLSLEALFYWILVALEGKPKGRDELVDMFLGQLPTLAKQTTADNWLATAVPSNSGPTELIKKIEKALETATGADLAPSIAAGIAFCLAEPPQDLNDFERSDRLPLFQACREAAAREKGPTKDFVRHILESWVLAQHVYWSVGRGLADARVQGKNLLRLKVILDENGWTLAPGLSRGSPPEPTPDRLRTMISLATECGLFNQLQLKNN